MDDLDGSLVDNIREQFCLPHELSKKYAALVFISSNRFDATKRSAGGLLLHQFIFCAIEMIDHWTIGSAGMEGRRERERDRGGEREGGEERRGEGRGGGGREGEGEGEGGVLTCIYIYIIQGELDFLYTQIQWSELWTMIWSWIVTFYRACMIFGLTS